MSSLTTPEFPIFIPSKSRAESALTPRFFDIIKVPYRLIVEESQYKQYSEHFDKSKLIVLPQEYLDNYDTCDELGNTKSKGPGAARNFAWDTSIDEGFKWHWVMDDNILNFGRLNKNQRVPVGDGFILRAMEDFVQRYKNVAMAGPNYFMFLPSRNARPPFTLNTRIYSCNLIRNDVPFRWRGRYNEDTDLSLMMLKAGWVTVQFNAFYQWKVTTQLLGGGNTEAFYASEGTLPKSKMLVDMHPDVARLSFKFSRWHHYVDYSGFKQQLVRDKSYTPIDFSKVKLDRIPLTEKVSMRRGK